MLERKQAALAASSTVVQMDDSLPDLAQLGTGAHALLKSVSVVREDKFLVIGKFSFPRWRGL